MSEFSPFLLVPRHQTELVSFLDSLFARQYRFSCAYIIRITENVKYELIQSDHVGGFSLVSYRH